jgi:hypothetical protein
MDVKLKFDPDPATLFPRDARTAFRVAMSAVNRTLSTGRTRITRTLRQEINLRARDIRAEIRIKRINLGDARTLTSSVEGRIDIKGRPIPVIDFPGTRQAAGGISVLVSRSKGRELLKDTFFATMKSGHRGVFERKRLIAFGSLSAEEQTHFSAGALHFLKSRLVRRGSVEDIEGKRAPRLPIQERFGKTLTGYLINAPDVLDREVAALGGILTKNIISQATRFLKRKGTDRFDDLLRDRLPAND